MPVPPVPVARSEEKISGHLFEECKTLVPHLKIAAVPDAASYGFANTTAHSSSHRGACTTLADCGLRCALPSDDVTAVPNPSAPATTAGNSRFNGHILQKYAPPPKDMTNSHADPWSKAFPGGICGSTGTLPAE
ncbi:hypothetical protein VTO73DRAFT_6692 [Trametes versicolor]